MENHDLQVFKAQAKAELNRLEAQSTAKEVAGKAVTVRKGDDTVTAGGK